MLNDTAVHILGGGIGGTIGAIVTCPLEVVKVRLQSSHGSILRYGPISIHSVSPDAMSSSKHSAQLVRRILPSKAQWMMNESDEVQSLGSSSHFKARNSTHPPCSSYQVSLATLMDASHGPSPCTHTGLRRSVLLRCLIDIAHTEGFRALFKGFFPTLIGVLPSRGVYFSAYHKGQVFFESHFPTGSSGVYFCAAGFGSITASSLTNPIWFIKTRLQLDSRPGLPPITVSQVIRNTWKHEGVRGFYRGVTASYVGSLETALNFVIYENVKAELLWWDRSRQQRKQQHFAMTSASPISHSSISHTNTSSCDVSASDTRELRGSLGGSKLNASSDMVLCMLASAFSKAVAITAAYPHEVVRTRLREADGRYRGFVNTIRMVVREEGVVGLYRGMGTHYIRQVPNSCIMIGTYEVVVFLLQSWGLTKRP